MARRILAYEPRSLHAVTIACSTSHPLEFLRERKSLRNLIAHQRRRSRWWLGTGLWGWWDGSALRGVVSLGSITTTEFTTALRRHRAVLVRPIEIEDLRTEVYAAAMSISVAARFRGAGRYQPFKIAIGPVIVAASKVPIVGSRMIEPLPIIV